VILHFFHGHGWDRGLLICLFKRISVEIWSLFVPLNERRVMDFKVAGLTPASFSDYLDTSRSNGISPISMQEIRTLRQNFERECEPLRAALGPVEHQTMLVTMYEGTEKLLNQRLPTFAVHAFLEDLKLSAQELRQQGISDREFRQQLMQDTQSKLQSLLNNG
jgi:hypothetical protein